MNPLQIAVALYEHFIGLVDDDTGEIPIELRAPKLVGTVQDDPFDSMVGAEIVKALPGLEVVHSGALTTPDILIRDRKSGAILGLEVKKLLQKPNGQDARGLTLDYNSCLPCGTALIKVGENSVEVPCFYLFCLLSSDSTRIVTLIMMDGDCLNYDFNLHKKAKFSNTSEYNHGPYGEGSVRHRDMYTYPNPLNSKLPFFHLRKIIVIKKHDADNMGIQCRSTHAIRRDDIYDNQFHYYILDDTVDEHPVAPTLLTDIFIDCKNRKPKCRTPAVPRLDE